MKKISLLFSSPLFFMMAIFLLAIGNQIVNGNARKLKEAHKPVSVLTQKTGPVKKAQQ